MNYNFKNVWSESQKIALDDKTKIDDKQLHSFIAALM